MNATSMKMDMDNAQQMPIPLHQEPEESTLKDKIYTAASEVVVHLGLTATATGLGYLGIKGGIPLADQFMADGEVGKGLFHLAVYMGTPLLVTGVNLLLIPDTIYSINDLLGIQPTTQPEYDGPTPQNYFNHRI